jgi:hypothetical protein
MGARRPPSSEVCAGSTTTERIELANGPHAGTTGALRRPATGLCTEHRPPCSVDGCSTAATPNGKCRSHYGRAMTAHRTPEQQAQRVAYGKTYYEAHKAECAARNKAWRAAHPDGVRARSKAWRDSHKGEPRTPEQRARRVARENARRAAWTPEQKVHRETWTKAYREAHKAEMVAYHKTYHEAHKAEHSARAKVYREAHKSELAEHKKAYRKAHLAEHAARDKAWRESHKDSEAARSRAKNNRIRAKRQGCKIAPDVSAATYARIMAGDPACTYCPARATHVDHVWPFDLYGAETDENLVPACATCNLDKKAKPLTEWAWAKVKYGAAHSSKVAAELVRLEAALA